MTSLLLTYPETTLATFQRVCYLYRHIHSAMAWSQIQQCRSRLDPMTGQRWPAPIQSPVFDNYRRSVSCRERFRCRRRDASSPANWRHSAATRKVIDLRTPRCWSAHTRCYVASLTPSAPARHVINHYAQRHGDLMTNHSFIHSFIHSIVHSARCAP